MICVPPVNKLPARDPPSFASSSKTRPGSCGLSILVLYCSSRRLPSIVRSRQTSSLVVFQRLPLHRLQYHASCPSLPINDWSTFGVSLPNESHLPPLPFLPASTVCSACCSTGLLHPAASHGVRGVSDTVSLQPHCCDGWSPVPFPHSLLIPFEVFPSSAAVLCHHIRFLPVVTSDFCFQSSFTRPQGLSPLKSPLPPTGISTCVGPILPWALFPFKVLPSYANALLKSTGTPPPKRVCSGPPPPKWTRPGLLSPRFQPSMNEHAHPNGRTAIAASRDKTSTEVSRLAGLPTYCQPALELFERPLLYFQDSSDRLR